MRQRGINRRFTVNKGCPFCSLLVARAKSQKNNQIAARNLGYAQRGVKCLTKTFAPLITRQNIGFAPLPAVCGVISLRGINIYKLHKIASNVLLLNHEKTW